MMKEINRIKDVEFLGLLDGNPVLKYKDHIEFNVFNIRITSEDDFCIMNNLIQGKKDGKEVAFYDGNFREFPPIRFEKRVMWSLKDSKYYDGDTFKLSYYVDGEERIFETKTKDKIAVCKCPANKDKDVLAFVHCEKEKYLFYSKTGEFLWQYTEEDASLKINWRCIPVVDDVVVIISEDISAVMKIQGFNIRTGELLWTLEDSDMTAACPDTFFVGDDNMLYGCDGYYGDTAELHLCRLNPITGELDTWVVLSDNDFDVFSWHVAMHGRRPYYTDNRKGKEIGVIDVDRKELVERQPMGIEKNVTLGAPVITDDKVYVYIRELNELRVYEK